MRGEPSEPLLLKPPPAKRMKTNDYETGSPYKVITAQKGGDKVVVTDQKPGSSSGSGQVNFLQRDLITQLKDKYHL